VLSCLTAFLHIASTLNCWDLKCPPLPFLIASVLFDRGGPFLTGPLLWSSRKDAVILPPSMCNLLWTKSFFPFSECCCTSLFFLLPCQKNHSNIPTASAPVARGWRAFCIRKCFLCGHSAGKVPSPFSFPPDWRSRLFLPLLIRRR